MCNRKKGLGFPTDTNLTVEELLITARDVARAENQASQLVRVLIADPNSSGNILRKSGAVPKANQANQMFRASQILKSDACWKCGKRPKSQRIEAFLPLPPPPLPPSDPVSQFGQLTLETQQRLLSGCGGRDTTIPGLDKPPPLSGPWREQLILSRTTYM